MVAVNSDGGIRDLDVNIQLPQNRMHAVKVKTFCNVESWDI